MWCYLDRGMKNLLFFLSTEVIMLISRCKETLKLTSITPSSGQVEES